MTERSPLEDLISNLYTQVMQQAQTIQQLQTALDKALNEDEAES